VTDDGFGAIDQSVLFAAAGKVARIIAVMRLMALR
jgi:hypothetical protein